jgi:pimeloyl-ACP methyl ester carboxylesterase
MAPAQNALGHAARPLTFEGCAAWLHPSAGDVGVLLCSPWGFEELCMRRGWRMLAARCADAGFPTLRFDYPGTGDSLGDHPPADLAALVAATVEAGGALRGHAGVRRLVLIGQGFGAMVASLAAAELGAEGIALLAPPARGREHLRELRIWGAMVAEAMHLTAPCAPGEVAGFSLPDALAASITTFDLADLQAAPARSFVALRPGRAAEARAAARLRDLGSNVTEAEYAGYEAALGNPTAARPPLALFDGLAKWLTQSFATEAQPSAVTPWSAPASLHGPGFREQMVGLEPGGLAGVLCEPAGPRRGATVLMLNAGGDPHTGWARANVDQARALAQAGVASLRLDVSDVGDAAGRLSAEPVKLYHEQPVQDAVAAVDWLEARGLGPVLVTGRCSGAYTAFAAALRDRRITEVVLVNQRRFIWHDDGEVEAAVDKVAHYQRQARNPLKLLTRWIRGELDLEAALARLGPAAVAAFNGLLHGHGRRLAQENRAALRSLQRRGVRLNLLYARGGEAHADLKALFGPSLGGLRAYENLHLNWLEGADHSLTPPAARAALLELLRASALAARRSVAVGAETEAAGRQHLAMPTRVLDRAVA